MNAVSRLILLFIAIALFINFMRDGANGVKRWTIYRLSGYDIEENGAVYDTDFQSVKPANQTTPQKQVTAAQQTMIRA